MLSRLSHIEALYGKKATLYVLGMLFMSFNTADITSVIWLNICISRLCVYSYANSQNCSRLDTTLNFSIAFLSFSSLIFSKPSPTAITVS